MLFLPALHAGRISDTSRGCGDPKAGRVVSQLHAIFCPYRYWNLFFVRQVGHAALVGLPTVEYNLLASIGSFHALCATILALMVVGHVAMVIYHHVVLKDKTLSRML